MMNMNSMSPTTGTMILACSSSTDTLQSRLLGVGASASSSTTKSTTDGGRDEIADGPLCQYQKGFLDHLTPKALITSVSYDRYFCNMKLNG